MIISIKSYTLKLAWPYPDNTTFVFMKEVKVRLKVQ